MSDDAPELTDAFFDAAEVFHGDTFIRRGPGRPRSDARKEQISVRLDPDVLAMLRESGPGWQSQINALLRQALRLDETQATAVAAPPLPESSASGPHGPVPPVRFRRIQGLRRH